MLRLSTYLGHVKPDHTYWYIEAVPELLQLASKRVERSLAKNDPKKGGAR
jgi:integrase/recombinase XerD